MNIEFDEAKEAVNLAKHGVSLALGAVLIEQAIAAIVDERREYGEIRVNAFGLIAGRLFVCTYTMRQTTARIILVWKASKQELRQWQSSP